MRPLRYLVVILALYGAFTIHRVWKKRTDGFSIEKIYGPKESSSPPIQLKASSDDIEAANALLHQEFFYLGKGFQCYVFESADGKYVIKFFRYQRLTLPLFYKIVGSIPLFEKVKENRVRALEKRKRHLFRGFSIAFEKAREETAVIYAHLAKTKGVHPQITIIDKAKRRFVVQLDDVEFFLQRKALHIKPTFDTLMLEGKQEEAKRRIDQIFDLFLTCAKRGIQDTDKSLIRKNNLGFLQDRAIYIDAGKLAIREKITTEKGFKEDFKKLIPLYEWLQKYHPELAPYFKKRQNEVIREFRDWVSNA